MLTTHSFKEIENPEKVAKLSGDAFMIAVQHLVPAPEIPPLTMQAVVVGQVKSVDRCRPQLSPGLSSVDEGRRCELASWSPPRSLWLVSH